MAKPTEKELLRANVERELNLLKVALRPLGISYHDFVKAYGRRDRGLKEAIELIRYIKEDVWPVFINERSILALFFPYIQQETEIINKLAKEIEEAAQIVENSIKRGGTTLYPEEVSKLVHFFQNPRIYLDYVVGRDYLTHKLLGGKKINTILKEFKPVIEAFEGKLIKGCNSDYNFYMGSVEGYAFLTLFMIDAYDNSLLKRLVEAKSEEEREKILKEYSPSQGLNQILFSVKEKMIEYNRESLRERKERKNLCLPKGGLAQRAKAIDNGSKFSSYIQEIYGNEEKRKESLPYM